MALTAVILVLSLTSSLAIEDTDETFVVQLNLRKDVVLPCPVKDNTTTNIIAWSHIGKEDTVFDGDRFNLNEEEYTLTIHHSDWDDVGEYECNVTANGEKYTRKISLQARPVVYKKLDKSNNLFLGDDLIVDCWVRGYPKPYVEWRKGDDPMVESDDGRIKFFEFEGIENASLKIENVQYNDRANYSCFAIVPNSNHTAQSSIYVRVKNKLDALWPFLGIIIMLIILAVIIILDRRHQNRLKAEREQRDQASSEPGPAEHENVRQRRK